MCLLTSKQAARRYRWSAKLRRMCCQLCLSNSRAEFYLLSCAHSPAGRAERSDVSCAHSPAGQSAVLSGCAYQTAGPSTVLSAVLILQPVLSAIQQPGRVLCGAQLCSFNCAVNCTQSTAGPIVVCSAVLNQLCCQLYALT